MCLKPYIKKPDMGVSNFKIMSNLIPLNCISNFHLVTVITLIMSTLALSTRAHEMNTASGK